MKKYDSDMSMMNCQCICCCMCTALCMLHSDLFSLTKNTASHTVAI